MTASKWPHEPSDPFMEMKVPRLYGSVPTLFAAPLAETQRDLAGFDVAFLGIPWQAPVPDSRVGAAAASYVGVHMTPHRFRTNSIKYGGYLPELDLDVFERLRIADYGDADIVYDMQTSLRNVTRKVRDIVESGCLPLTMGGNGGVSSYPVLQAIAECAPGPVGVVNLDAHHDNRTETPAERADNRNPRWGGTWANRILELPGVDPAHYIHVGLRGPRNDRGTIPRFLDRGVNREHIYTFRDILAARQAGFEGLASEAAARACEGMAKVWIAVDPDVLDLSAAPDFGDEPLGLHVEEILEIVRQVGRRAGRQRLGGLTFMAVPPDALRVHWICIYILLYAFAGMLEA